MDYGKTQWPNWQRQFPSKPEQILVELKEYLELVAKAKKFDEISNQPHCEDPEKVKLLEKIEARIQALEELNRKRIFPDG